jgi:hypothetical protein
MAAQAAHLVDCVLPAVPIRQFVLSFPFELSRLAATKPEVLRTLARIHAEELARHYKQAAKKSGEGGKLHAGVVTFVQRFGSSLNLHVHLHTCARGGVYAESEEGEAPRFVPRAPPSRAELYVLAERVALRVMTWLRKRGHAKDDDHASNDAPERTFAEVRAQLATQRGILENVKDDTGESEGPAEPAAPSSISTKPSRATASTCTRASPSTPTMISAESDCAGTASVRPSRSRASAFRPRLALRRPSTQPSSTRLRSRDRPRALGLVRPSPDPWPPFRPLASRATPECSPDAPPPRSPPRAGVPYALARRFASSAIRR